MLHAWDNFLRNYGGGKQMTVQGSRSKMRTRQILTAWLAVMLTLMQWHIAAAHADPVKRRVIPLTINKGQNYTISGVKPGTQPGIKVLSNPHALVVQTAPGRIELVGADAGSWNLKVTLDTGEKVLYAITVNAGAPPQGNLAPGAAPTAIP
jgi:hypothetical protein